MNEISCRVTRMLIEAVVEAGIEPERLVEGLGVSVAELRDVRRRVDWNVFAALHDNVEGALGRGMALEDVGARIVRAPSFALLQLLGGSVVDARALHRAGARWLSPVIFPHIEVCLSESAENDRRLVIEARVPAEYREGRAFFQVCAGSLRMVSALVDGRPSIVESRIDGWRAVYTVTLPERVSFLSRLARSARMVLGGPEVLAALGEEQRAVNACHDALLRTRQGFLDALERSPACAMIQREGRVAWANTALARALGRTSAEELVGRSLLELVDPEHRASVVERMKRPPRETPASREYRMRRSDGTLATFEMAPTQEIEFDGRSARLLVGIDVSERKRMQEQLLTADRMASLGMLAAGIAHEINNPLAYVLMNLEIATASLPPEAARAANALETTRAGVERIRVIASDLKTFARASSDAVEPVDVCATLESTLTLIAHALRDRAVVSREYVDVPAVSANAARLGQVFLNVLLNALDAVGEVRRDGRLLLRTSPSPDGRVVIEIADNGAGISAEHLERVFDPFFTTKPVGSGTGLGLSICHGIIRDIGGEIALDSQRGVGTTVRIVLPAWSGEANVSPSAGTAPPSSPRRGRVLVIDDEEELLRALSAILGETHEVQVAASGTAALELLRRDRQFDAVLCDVMMPDIGGIELFEELSRFDHRFARRVVFMTGGVFTERAREFLARSSNRWLEKPFDRQQLLEAIDSPVVAGPGDGGLRDTERPAPDG